MSVRRRKNWVSQQRVDVPDMRAIESAVSNDFDEMLNAMVTGPNNSFVMRGFDILMTGSIGNAANGLQLLVDNASLLHGASDESGTFFVVPEGTSPLTLNSSINPQVVGSFTPSAQNFISLEFKREIDESTIGPVAVWNPTNQNEVTRNLPLAVLMDYEIRVSTSLFATNTVPLAVVQTDSANNVVSIEDRRPMLFRLGTAGFDDPDPFSTFDWDLQAEGREENDTKAFASTQNPFRGGDKQLDHLKRWMDAVMTQFLEIKGTPYWYSFNTGGSIFNLRADLAHTVFTGRGVIAHSKETAGLLTWSTDVNLRFVSGRHSWKIEENQTTFLQLENNQVAYVQLTRGVDVIPELIWVNGGTTVESVGAIPWTGDLEPGDFIKQSKDDDTKYYEILTIDSASQVTLVEAYQEDSTGSEGAPSRYAFGNYRVDPAPSSPRHIFIADREDVPFNQDIFWLYFRDDNTGATQEVTRITTRADVNGDLDGKYFLLFDTYNLNQYYVYYTVAGSGTDPQIPGYAPINVDLSAQNESADNVANRTAIALTAIPGVTATFSFGGIVDVSLDKIGFASDIIDGQVPQNTAFTFDVTQQGTGATVYARFLGSELEQGERRQISDEDNLALYEYTGSAGEFDSTPDYTNSLGQSFENIWLIDDENLTKGLKRLEQRGDVTPRVDHIDLRENSTLPGGNSLDIDGKTVNNGDIVLFTHPDIEGFYRVGGVGGAVLTWFKLAWFNGDANPMDGATAKTRNNATNYLETIWERIGGEWKPVKVFDARMEPTGFRVLDESIFSFDDLTRTFTIQPAPGNDWFDYFQDGVIYREINQRSVQIADSDGPHAIVFDGRDFISLTGFTSEEEIDNLFLEYVLVAVVYWCSADNESTFVWEQRHGIVMDGDTHVYLHDAFGTIVQTGFEATWHENVDEDGNEDVDAQLALADGELLDEDIRFKVQNPAGPAYANGLAYQDLDPILRVPIYYRDGAAGKWKKIDANDFPVIPGVGGGFEITDFHQPAFSDVSNGQYCFVRSANNATLYYIWYNNQLPPANEIQEIDFSIEPESGDFSLELAGEFTANIPFSATPGDVKTALEALPSVNEVTVTGDFSSGFTVEFTGPDANKPFQQLQVFSNTLEFGAAVAANELQRITFSNEPTSGQWVLNLDGNTTAPLAFNESNANIKAALEALPNINEVTVTGDYIAGIEVEFTGLDAETNFSQLSIAASTLQGSAGAGQNEIQRIQWAATPVGGDYTLNFQGDITLTINYNDNAATVQTRLEALPSIGVGNVQVTGDYTTQFDIEFIGTLEKTNLPQISVDTNTTFSGFDSGIDEIQVLQFGGLTPDAGSFQLQFEGNNTAVLGFGATALDVQNELNGLPGLSTVTVTGDIPSGFIVSFVGADGAQDQTLITIINNTLKQVTQPFQEEIQRLTWPNVPAKGGWAIGYEGGFTNPMTFNESNANIANRLITDIPPFNAGGIVVTGDYSTFHDITWGGTLGGIDWTQVTTGDEDFNPLEYLVSAGVTEIQTLTFSAVPTEGQYTLSHNGNLTGFLNFNDNAATIQAALEGLVSIGAGNIAVTGNYASGFTLTFQGALTETAQPQIVPSFNNLQVLITPNVNEIQRLDIGTAVASWAGGVFRLTMDGQQTLDINIPVPQTLAQLATDVQTALNNLPNRSGMIVTTTTPGGGFVEALQFEYAGADGNQDQTLFSVSLNTLVDGGASPVSLSPADVVGGSTEVKNAVTITPNTTQDGVDPVFAPVAPAVSTIQDGQVETAITSIGNTLVLQEGGDPQPIPSAINLTNVQQGAPATSASTVIEVNTLVNGTPEILGDPVSVVTSTTQDGQGAGDPAPGGVGIEVVIAPGDTPTNVATKVKSAIDAHPQASLDFTTALLNNGTVRVTNVDPGPTTDANNVDVNGLVIEVVSQGTDNSNARIRKNIFDTNTNEWILTDAIQDDDIIPMWIFATLDVNEPIIAIAGQGEYDKLSTAQGNETPDSIDYGNLPQGDIKVLHRLLFRTNSEMGNNVRAALVDLVDWRKGASVQFHGNLSGLDEPDHGPTAVRTDNVDLTGSFFSEEDIDLFQVLNTINDVNGLIRIKKHPTNPNRVILTGAERFLNSDAKVNVALRRFVLEFPGVEIDFATQEVFRPDGITPYPSQFESTATPSSEFRWFGISLKNLNVRADNRLVPEIRIDAGTNSAISPELASKPRFSASPVGAVVVQQVGPGIIEPITDKNFSYLAGGVGGGGTIEIFRDGALVTDAAETLNFVGLGIRVEETSEGVVEIEVAIDAIKKDEEGNVEINTNPVEGEQDMVLRAPDNSKWKVFVEDDGQLRTEGPIGDPETEKFLITMPDSSLAEITVNNAGELQLQIPPLEPTAVVDDTFYLRSPTGYFYKFKGIYDPDNGAPTIVMENPNKHLTYNSDAENPMWRVQQTDRDRAIMYLSIYNNLNLPNVDVNDPPLPFTGTQPMAFYDTGGGIKPIYFDTFDGFWKFFDDNTQVPGQ